MPKYLIQVAMHREGIQNVLTKAKGTGLRAAVTKFAESAGGRLEAYYFAFGRHDAVAIMDLPDNVSAVALSVAASGSGTVTIRILRKCHKKMTCASVTRMISSISADFSVSTALRMSELRS